MDNKAGKWLVTVAVVLTICAVDPSSAFQVELVAETSASANYLCAGDISETSPETTPVPLVVSGKALFIRDRHLPTKLPMIADEPDGAGTGYSRLWVDLNGDQTYTEDEHIAAAKPYRSDCPSFGSFQCMVEETGLSHPVTYTAMLNLLNDAPIFILNNTLAYTGVCHFGEQKVDLRLIDHDGDGRVLDFIKAEPDAPIASALECRFEANDKRIIRLPLVRTLGLFGNYYRVDGHLVGDARQHSVVMTFEPLDVARQTVNIEGSGVEGVVLATRTAAVYASPSNNRFQVPAVAGEWQVIQSRAIENGVRFLSSSCYGSTDSINEGTNGTMVLKVGGPLTHRIEVGRAGTAGALRIRLSESEGVGGIRYNPVNHDGEPSATWIVRRRGGGVARSGDFGFG